MAIRAEWPGYWQEVMLESFYEEVVKLDTIVLPFRKKVESVGGQVRRSVLNTHGRSLRYLLPTFVLKWMCGRARPEEVAFAIQNGAISASAVPEDIKTTLFQWKLSKARRIHGLQGRSAAPPPRGPAMHSAASSSCSFWTTIAYDLTQEQKCQAVLTDWNVSYGRTVAGAHCLTDNIVGLNLVSRISGRPFGRSPGRLLRCPTEPPPKPRWMRTGLVGTTLTR
jgi:hypothetical protein